MRDALMRSHQLERIEAARLFASKEAEEKAKMESVKTFVPGEVPTEEPKEEEPSKPVGPTPEQIIAIKVLSSSYACRFKPFKCNQVDFGLYTISNR
ncbi:hypothetical protein Hanom_Chr04g00290681 [Helianthus anomalus]